MNNVLTDLRSINGVIGGYLYGGKRGLISNGVPSIFKEDKLSDIGRTLVKLFGLGQLSLKDIKDAVLYYEEALVLVRNVIEDAYLIVLCDPSFNVNLLTMSLNLAMDEMTVLAQNGARSNEVRPLGPDKAPASAAGERRAWTLTEVRASSPVAEPLRAMEEALAKIMGPMAAVVFQDALEGWLKSSEPSPETLPGLVEFLAMEIGDPERTQRYRGLVAAHVPMHTNPR